MENDATPYPSAANAESIVDGIQQCQLAMEESRLSLRPIMATMEADEQLPADETKDYSDGKIAHDCLGAVEHIFGSIGVLISRLADGGLISLDEQGNPQGESSKHNRDDVYLLMASNCITKAAGFVGHHCFTLLEGDSMIDDGPLDDYTNGHGQEEHSLPVQPCMARLAELTLRILHIEATIVASDNGSSKEFSPESLIEAYADYQRRCVRTRSKSSITSLAELRRIATNQGCHVSDILDEERRRQQFDADLHSEDDENDEDPTEGCEGGTARRQPHAQAITVILGEASSLMQPLAAWRDALAPTSEGDNELCLQIQRLCQESVETLDNEAQTLASTVGSWFVADQSGLANLEQSTANDTHTRSDLLSIESSLEEMAFMCQVVARYCEFSKQTLPRSDPCISKLQDLLTENSLHYSTLETRLATMQFRQALSLASPQLIELGRPALQVPSIVEDAHYICVRAIERASGTRSEQAIWTVGHFVCEIWGANESEGIYNALMEGIGCVGDSLTHENGANDMPITPAKVDNAFAAALLDAVDDGGDDQANPSRSNPNSAPPSGGLSALFGGRSNGQSQQKTINSELCALNGIAAASNSCSALSNLFGELVDENTQEPPSSPSRVPGGDSDSSMLTLARDEMCSHSQSYTLLLKKHAHALVSELCGGDDLFDCDGGLCLQNLRLFIEGEVYNINSASLSSLESDDRLESAIIGPIRSSKVFEEIAMDKCEAVVVLQIAEAMSSKTSEIILQTLLRGDCRFNEWGAMLLSKQVRLLQNVFCELVLEIANSSETATAPVNTAPVLQQFEKVKQAVSILQLEKPSDWLSFSYEVGDSDETNLTTHEIEKIMNLRDDFSEEAIARVCIQMAS